MKPLFQSLSPGPALACLLSLALTSALTATAARAQKTGGPEAAAQRPPAAGHAATKPAATPQSEVVTRERRAQAYAKLLEGQRYYASARTGRLSIESLRSAQKAFQEAAELDPTLAEAHTALAEIAFFFLNDLAQAEREGEAATRVDPDNFGGHRVLSRIYTIRSGLPEGRVKEEAANAERAIKELREVVRLRPGDAEALALLGDLYQALGREREAIEAYTRWAATAPPLEGRFYQVVTRGRELTPDAAHARLAEALLRAGRAAEAVVAIRQALTVEPDNASYLRLLGEVMDAGGDGESVIAELRRLVTINPKNVAATEMLARSLSRAGRVEEALKTLRDAAERQAGGSREQLSLKIDLAQTLADALRYDEAVGVYEELLKARGIGDQLAPKGDREFASAVLNRMYLLRRRAGQAGEAQAVIARMRRVLGDDPITDIQNVELLRSQKRHQEALLAVRAARQQYPDEVRLPRLEAQVLADLGRVDEALDLLRSRLRGTPEDYNEHLYIANILVGVGRGPEAVEAARKAVQAAPSDRPELTTQALVILSSAQERAGDPKGSEESLRQILVKDPNNPTALNNLGYFLTERNERLNEALEMIQRAVRAEPNNASFLDSLGWIYFKLGNLQDAERYLSDAARRNPDSAAIQEHLGDLFYKLGRKDQARDAWQKAISLSVEAAGTRRIKAKLDGITDK